MSEKDEAARNFLAGKENKEGTAEENEPKVTSLGKINTSGREISDGPVIPQGYTEIYSENFPSKGIGYVEGTRFFIRPAKSSEIREFSSMNENDGLSVNEGLNAIVKGCLDIRGNGKRYMYKDLLEEDRVYVLLEIRQLTFVKGENHIIIPVECNECGTLNEIKLNNSILEANEFDPTLLKYLDESTGILNIKTKSFGVVSIKTPSIGSTSKVLDFMQAERAARRKPDTTFVKIAPYLILDWRKTTTETISSMFVDYLAWDGDKLSFMISLVEKMRVGVSENLKSECMKCTSLIEAPISFPDGIKSLFIVPDISGELL